jgi:hypothetical protein
MSENVIQKSFAAGELAPSLFARVDLQKYHSGAAVMRNFFVDYRSGASTRTGTEFVGQAYKSSTAVRLIPFQYSVITSYVLEFGDFYIRFISNGGYVLETAFSVSAATTAIPAVVTVDPLHNFALNDWIYLSGLGGMTQIDNRFFKIISISGSALTLADVNGTAIDSRNYSAYTSGGTAARVYTLTSPYAAADLALLKYIQSASVMTLTHTSYAPRNLSLITPTNWSLTTITIGSQSNPPTGVVPTASSAGAANYAYVVTSVDSNGQESQASTPGTVAAAVNIGATAGSISTVWVAPVTGNTPDHYNIYKAEMSLSGAVPSGAAFGYVGSATGLTFVDSNIVPDFSTTPPIAQNPLLNNNPSCLCYFQQRLYFAASVTQPLTFWASQPGNYYDFDISSPIQPDDALSGLLVSFQVNAIKSMVPMPGGLVLLTAKGAWQLTAGSGANATIAVTPINATAVPQAYNGASDVFPIIINYDVLYVQAKGSIVRDLSYNLYAQIYTGSDISVLSNHLFFGHQITQWAYAEEPFKIVWSVRDDGVLLSLTFVKEQEMMGWARHDTLGLFQSICTVTEGQVDAIYVVVKRYIGGQWVQMVERMADRIFTYGAEDAWSVDCGLQSSLPTPAAGLIASAASGTVTFTADAGVFNASTDVGKVLRMGGGIAAITAVTSPTIATGTLSQDISATLTDGTPLPAASGDWSLTIPITTISGLDHLTGQTVSILADGGVVTPQVVAAGQVTLPNAATKVTVGLPFTAQIQTMPLDIGEPTIQGKRKNVSALTIRAVESRGLKAGRSFSTLIPIKELSPNTPLGSPVPLITGDERITVDSLWDVPGQICIQQDNPLPATVLGLIPEISVGDQK